MDEAALDCGGGPARGDCVGGAASTVDDGDQWCGDAFDEESVVVGGFVGAPVPGDDVGGGCGDDEARAGGVGAVEEDLVVDLAGVAVGGVGDVDEPASGESSFHGGVADTVASGDGCQRCCRCAVFDELGEHCGVGDVRAGFRAGGSAGCASPAGGAFARGSVAFHLCAAVAAWSVLRHWNTTSPPPTTGWVQHRVFRVGGLDICSRSVYSVRSRSLSGGNHRFRTHILTLNPHFWLTVVNCVRGL